ncbi:FecR family protein [Chitinophaga sp. Cy-1792]|uniref:FecR family protein n=1 Tax=Chitinophaga sp. Cy-1792 TaxID=2608339 RepID=UPI00142250E1|nr:FecR family protein [Chitinophaga sp. Cy-1792]NIG57533.1 DUF4974 domain-containing protein [Chitinophaga sp. Cy-1792]
MERLEYLFNKYLQKKHTAAEKEELFELIARAEHDTALKYLIDEALLHADLEMAMPAAKAQDIYSLIVQTAAPVKVVPMHRGRWKYAAAAAVLLAIVGSTYLFRSREPVPPKNTGMQYAMDVAAAKQGAILTLADGSQVTLDSAGNGLIAMQQGKKVVLDNGEIKYDGNASGATVAWNQMTTPRGRQFRLVLPDGTKVWMNAASSLKYPTEFSGNERLVEASGEVYFEVAKMAAQPFRVKLADSSQVQVLGTAFNIHNYKEEPTTRITLLEGSVLVNNAGQRQLLKPGQQATVSQGTMQLVAADTSQVVAWKNGDFDFNDMDLPYVLNEISRWYDVEIIYEGKMPVRKFGGGMQRNLSLQQVLNLLEKAQVNFRLTKDRKLIIM